MQRRSIKNPVAVGIDFGTLSARALLVEVETGREIAWLDHAYKDGVLDRKLPAGKHTLELNSALQNPADYLEALTILPRLLRQAGVAPEQVIGLGTDFTSCTILPVTREGVPLCFDHRWKRNPHAWVKLWKHHAAQPEANRINEIASRLTPDLLRTYGGKYSSEWFFSKVLETLNEAPEIYAAAERFIEAGDWIVWQLCGREVRGLSAAGFKAMRVCPPQEQEWNFPAPEFFHALHPRLKNVVTEKMNGPFLPPGAAAGGLAPEMAERVGLLPGTPIAIGNIDAHAAVPACGVTQPGKLVMIMGTSTCHLLLGTSRHFVEGMCGVVQDGVVPGLWSYEAGQAAVGDIFAWHAAEGAPGYIQAEAKQRKVSIHELLTEQASALAPGESGLLALDWWNGNRSVLVDANLSGVLLGATLATKPHEIYRALMEATGFGTRKIIESFTNSGLPVRELYACGGLAQKNPLLMQIYADITGMPIRLAASEQASALGAAMYATVASGYYPHLRAAAARMTRLHPTIYRPKPAFKRIYDRLYAEYNRLHDSLGRADDSPLKVLDRLKRDSHNARKAAIVRSPSARRKRLH